MRVADEIHNGFWEVLYKNVGDKDNWPEKRPMLSHYTSLKSLEQILENNEVWFSNPLFMNDLDELRFGISEGISQFLTNDNIAKACRTKERHDLLVSYFKAQGDSFNNKHALDVYVFCTSEHEQSNTDGLLSMWRGYGGNGNGVAIIFDTKQFYFQKGSPLIISNVEYLSTEDRKKRVREILDVFANLLAQLNPADNQLSLAAYHAFERIKLFSLFTKHRGFIEEREWRFVYLKNRDTNKLVEPMCHYAFGSRGLEPKLKFKAQPINGLLPEDFSLSKVIHKLILGPMASSPLACATVHRMLDSIKKSELKSKVIPSTIPFRVV